MKWEKNKKKITAFSLITFLTIVGTYNSVMINSDSSLQADAKFVKRLDEVYGVVKPGRMLAASMSWQKIERPRTHVQRPVIQTVSTVDSSISVTQGSPDTVITAAVQDELQLDLVEVINPKKYAQGLTASQFSGNLVTNNGVIESLSVSLPNGEGVSVSFSEMTGNVFEYDYNGELYSGMMYQVDQKSYMVTLSNGPLEGTRMRFTASQENVEQNLGQLSEEQVQQEQTSTEQNFGQPTEPEQEPVEQAQMQSEELPQMTPETAMQQDQMFQNESLQHQNESQEQVL